VPKASVKRSIKGVGMRLVFRALVASVLVVSLSGCDKVSKLFSGKEKEVFQKDGPDFGGVKVVEVEAQGAGPTHAAAIADAISTALLQANGATLAQVSGTEISPQNILAISGGAIQGFEVLSETQDRNAKQWQVRLKVKVNKYEGAGSGKLPKVAVAMPIAHQNSYVIGDQVLSAQSAAGTIQGIIGDALRKSNRFAIIQRKYDDAINSELANISSGVSSPAGYAKLGQRLSADILIVPEINSLSYNKSTRILRFSGRGLNSFSGGVDINFNVINVATGQVILTEHFSTAFPSTPPSVYGTQAVGISNVNAYLAQLSDQFTHKFIVKNFPIAVTNMDGKSVVLSQGEAMLKVGETYSAVALGDKIKDPQTGQDLGRLETPIGTIRIVKTAEKMAFGQLNGNFDPAKFQPGIIELRDLVGGMATSASPSANVPGPQVGGLPVNNPSTKDLRKPAKSRRVRDEFDAPFEN